MPTLLTLDTARGDDGKLVLVASGEIDLSNVETFTDALSRAIAENVGTGDALTVDLSAVEYLDSAAINALFPYADDIRLIAHPLLVRVFDISGLTEVTRIESAPPQTSDWQDWICLMPSGNAPHSLRPCAASDLMHPPSARAGPPATLPRTW